MMNYALITGGAGGIGTAVADRFLSAGLKVIVFDINENNNLQIDDANRNNLLFYNVNMSDANEIIKITEKLAQKGIKIQHCISLAGGALVEEFNGLEKLDGDLIEKSIQLNLSSHIVLSKYILPLMKSCDLSNKSITFVSSINALMDFGLPAYSAAKSGLLGITKVLSSEVGKYNIRVNSLLPGTTITKKTLSEPKAYNEYLKGSLLSRFATADEIAEVIYCISENLTCITGQHIIADCGQTVKGYYENY
jgi:NAD(P)-dependent dehydrogenase (short-subunit alcohol dehydrogenase family)